MTFRRFSTVLVVVTILFGSTQVENLSAAGIGQSCSKVAATATIKLKGKNTKILCVKTGGISRWQVPVSAMRTDSSITPLAKLPSPNVCQITDATPGEMSSGFPRSAGLVPSSGKLKILVIPVIFSDLEFTDSDLGYVKNKYQKVAEYFNESSYGVATVEATYADKDSWVNLGTSLEQNGFINAPVQTNRVLFYRNVIDLYESKKSLAGFDIVEVVTSNTNLFDVGYGFTPGESQYGTKRTFGGVLSTGAAVFAWDTLAHELGHAWLGFEDLYFFATSLEVRAGFPVIGAWDLMGRINSQQRELSGWSRWLAGWIASSSVRCVESSSSSRHFLEPLAAKQTSTSSKVLVFKLTANSAIVIEYRAESKYNETSSKLLVYKVDTTYSHGQGPMRLVAEIGKAGTAVSSDTIKITLLKIDSTGVVVSIDPA